VLEALNSQNIKVLRKRHYHEFDKYFTFEDSNEGLLRYREDEFLNDKEEITKVRSRLTLIGQTREDAFQEDVMLSRSRYYAPATHSLRFYREYFQPIGEIEIEKMRQRFLVQFKDTEFFVNVDTMIEPALGHFVELKSRTWGKKDAISKSKLILELIKHLGLSPTEVVTEDYIHIVKNHI